MSKHSSRDMRYLTRMDYEKAHGWFVRVSAAGKVLASRFFSESKHGGTDAALVRAQRFRDQATKTLAGRLGYTPHGRKHHTRHSRNVSGAPGVSPTVDQRTGERVVAWLAVWTTPEGEQDRQRFWVSRHGYERAFRLAVETRARLTGTHPFEGAPPSERAILMRLRRRERTSK